MQYVKVKRNMLILLCVGILLNVIFFWVYGKLYPYSTVMYSMLGILILLALLFYPIAIVYGRDQIKDLFQAIANGARQPFTAKVGSVWNGFFKVLNFVFACVTAVSFGWAYGSYIAWQRLQFSKRFSQMNRRR